MIGFDESVFWPAMQSVNMLTPVRVKQSGKPAVDVHVEWFEPDLIMASGAQSRAYDMKYQTADLPALAEKDVVQWLDAGGLPIKDKKFEVREPPRVSDNPAESQTGFFRRAALTKL